MASQMQTTVLAAIEDLGVTGSEAVTDWIDARVLYENFLATVIPLAPPDTAALDFDVQKASDSSGTGATAFLEATQRAAHATDNDKIIVAFNFARDEIDVLKPWVRLRAWRVADDAIPFGLFILGFSNKHGPVVDYDTIKLVEIVNQA